MKNQTLPSSRSEVRGGDWLCLLLAACCALLTGLAWPARAGVIEAWVHRYNGPANSDDQATAVAMDGSGNVVVTGYSSNGSDIDFYTAKYAAADGALLWERRYNGPADGDDLAKVVAVDRNGDVVVTGYSEYVTNSNYYTAKYAAADGVLLWEKRGPGGRTAAVAADGSGNVVVTGTSYDGTNYDYYTAKYASADGALLWEKRYNGGEATALAVDGSGNVVVSGSSATLKYAGADGTLLWEKWYAFANALAVDGSGNVVMIEDIGGSYLAKIAAADGALLWEKPFGPVNKIHQALAVDGNGNVVTTGFSYCGGLGSDSDCYTAKYAAADGALLWEKHSTSGGAAVAVDGGGDVVVSGYSWNGTNVDYYTAKYAALDGALLWEKSYNGPDNGREAFGSALACETTRYGRTARSLALGPNWMVAITGPSEGNHDSVTTYDYATVVYWENLPPVSMERVPTGIRLRFTGVPGRSYGIERALAVTGPWSTLATPTAPPGGLIEYVDTNAPAASAFYRTSAL